jgi:internalin A
MTRDELLAIIDQAEREGWTELDLRDEEIRELPPEIGRLTRLEELRIGRKDWVSPEKRNPLTSLPPEIGQLTNLKVLDLSNQQPANGRAAGNRPTDQLAIRLTSLATS